MGPSFCRDRAPECSGGDGPGGTRSPAHTQLGARMRGGFGGAQIGILRVWGIRGSQGRGRGGGQQNHRCGVWGPQCLEAEGRHTSQGWRVPDAVGSSPFPSSCAQACRDSVGRVGEGLAGPLVLGRQPCDRLGSHPRSCSGCGSICKSNRPVPAPVHTPYIGSPGCDAAREHRGLDGELQTAGGGWSSQAPPCPCSCPSLRMRPQGSGRKAGGEGLGRAGAQGASWRRGLGTYRGRALSPPPLL